MNYLKSSALFHPQNSILENTHAVKLVERLSVSRRRLVLVIVAPKLLKYCKINNIKIPPEMDEYLPISYNLNQLSGELDAISRQRQNRLEEQNSYDRTRLLNLKNFWENNSETSIYVADKKLESSSKIKKSGCGTLYNVYSPEECVELSSKVHEIKQQYEHLVPVFRVKVQQYLQWLQHHPKIVDDFLQSSASLAKNEQRFLMANSNKPTDVTEFVDFPLEPGQQILLDCLCRLRDAVYAHFLYTSQEVQDQMYEEKQCSMRCSQLLSAIQLLDENIEAANLHQTLEIKKLDSTISELQENISSLKEHLNASINKIQAETARQCLLEEKNVEARCNRLSVELEEVTKEALKRREENTSSLKGDHVTRFKLESELENKWAAYDADMFKIQTEYNAILPEYLEQQDAIREYNDKLEDLREEYEQILADKALQAELDRKALERKEELTEAISTIQAFGRAYLYRKASQRSTRKKKI